MADPDLYTVALIKGAVEGDLYAHFGSLGGVAAHIAIARQHGLLEIEDQHTPTNFAHQLYIRHRLDQLPNGRAYLAWHDSPIVAATLAELTG